MQTAVRATAHLFRAVPKRCQFLTAHRNFATSSSAPAVPSSPSPLISDSSLPSPTSIVTNTSTPDSVVEEAVVTSVEKTSTSGILDATADILEQTHESLHPLPWSVTLPLAALTLRLCTVPLQHHAILHNARAAVAAKAFPQLQAFVRAAPGSLSDKYFTWRRLRAVALRSAGTAPWRLFPWHVFAHAPLLLLGTFSVRRLADRGVEAWHLSPPATPELSHPVPTDNADSITPFDTYDAVNPADATSDAIVQGLPFAPELAVADPTGVLPICATALWVFALDPSRAKPSTEPAATSNTTSSKSDTNGNTTDETKAASAARVDEALARLRSGLSTVLQMGIIAALPMTSAQPAALTLFWTVSAASGLAVRLAFSSDSGRRVLNLPTAEDIQRAPAPAVLAGVRQGMEDARKQLSQIQSTLLDQFAGRPANTALVTEVNSVLRRHFGNGRLAMRMEAVLRTDESTGRPYIAVVSQAEAALEKEAAKSKDSKGVEAPRAASA